MKVPSLNDSRKGAMVEIHPEHAARALSALVQVLLPVLRAELATGAAPDDDPWISHRKSPLGARRTRELCRVGAFKSARKEGKVWYVRRSEIDARIEASEAPPERATVHSTAPANDATDADPNAGVRGVLAELGRDFKPSLAPASAGGGRQ